MTRLKLVWWYVLLIGSVILLALSLTHDFMRQGHVSPDSLFLGLLVVSLLFFVVAVAMKARVALKIGTVLFLVAVVGLVISDTYEYISESLSGDIKYYSRAPLMLLVSLGVMLIVTVGGLLLMRLSPRRRRKVILAGWGALNILGIVLLVFFAHMTVSLALIEWRASKNMVWEFGGSERLLCIITSMLVLGGAAGLVFSWRAFLCYLRKHRDSRGKDSR